MRSGPSRPLTPVPDAVERGRALFNAGRYFEAHEVWEEVWLRERGEGRLLLQGLIQIAAALFKASSGGSASGCVRLLDAGLEKLEANGDTARGLALDRFRRDVTGFRNRAEAWRHAKEGPPAPPYPKLARWAARPAAKPG